MPIHPFPDPSILHSYPSIQPTKPWIAMGVLAIRPSHPIFDGGVGGGVGMDRVGGMGYPPALPIHPNPSLMGGCDGGGIDGERAGWDTGRGMG